MKLFLRGTGSIGRASDSKPDIARFDSGVPCQVFRVASQSARRSPAKRACRVQLPSGPPWKGGRVWFMASVPKTEGPSGSVGSNPASPSNKTLDNHMIVGISS